MPDALAQALPDEPLAALTTLRLGSAPRRLVRASTEAELVAAVCDADAAGERVVLLGGGSNTVAPDEPLDAVVVQVATLGTRQEPLADGQVLLRVQAGEPWDALVSRSVAAGLAGWECLSGIPGSTGATPVQNVGAYGQDVSQTITEVRVLDRVDGEIRTLAAGECTFGYRTSRFKTGADVGRFLVLEVAFALRPAGQTGPVAYAELARALGVEPGERASLAATRAAVLRLRRGKGMVVDPGDADSRSAGSFFTNPVLDEPGWDALVARVHARCGDDVTPPRFIDDSGRRKTSAAWLIERAGFTRGHERGTAQLSSKHTLALTARGSGTSADLVALAREVRDGVHDAFGVALHAEPVLLDDEV